MEHDTGKTDHGIRMKILTLGKTDYNLNKTAVECQI